MGGTTVHSLHSAIKPVDRATGENTTNYMCSKLADIVSVPAIFEFVLNYLQSVATFSHIAHCDQIINSFLQPELRSSSLTSCKQNTSGQEEGDLVLVQGNWCWNSTGGSNSSQPPSVGSEAPTPPWPQGRVSRRCDYRPVVTEPRFQ